MEPFSVAVPPVRIVPRRRAPWGTGEWSRAGGLCSLSGIPGQPQVARRRVSTAAACRTIPARCGARYSSRRGLRQGSHTRAISQNRIGSVTQQRSQLCEARPYHRRLNCLRVKGSRSRFRAKRLPHRGHDGDRRGVVGPSSTASHRARSQENLPARPGHRVPSGPGAASPAAVRRRAGSGPRPPSSPRLGHWRVTGHSRDVQSPGHSAARARSAGKSQWLSSSTPCRRCARRTATR